MQLVTLKRMSFFTIITWITVLTSDAFAASYAHLYRPPGKTLEEKAYEYELIGRAFQTTGTFDSDGTEFVLGDNESFLQLQSDFILRYGMNDNFQLSGGLRFRQVTAEYAIGAEDYSTTKSGVESYFFEMKYSQKSSTQLSYSFDFWARQTAYENTSYINDTEIPEDEVLIGDSGSSYYGGLSVSYMRAKDHYLNAVAGYHQPGNDLSAEVPYDINTVWTWTRFALLLGVEGIFSLGADEFSDAPSNKQAQGRGPSALYNSINRQWMAPKAAAYYAFGSWRLGLQVASRMSGVSTDKGTEFMVSLLKASRGKTVTSKVKQKFKEYRIEGTVLKVSPRGKFVRIDQGLSQDVEKGMKFDIYQTDFFGGNELIATAIAYEVAIDKAILKIVKMYSRKRVKKGFVARAQ